MTVNEFLVVAEKSAELSPSRIPDDYDWEFLYKTALEGLNRGDLTYSLLAQIAAERIYRKQQNMSALEPSLKPNGRPYDYAGTAPEPDQGASQAQSL